MKPCWIWPGNTNRDGYPVVPGMHGKQLLLCRVLWEQAHGPIPAGYKVLHRCDRPSCVRLAHFFLGTDADNMRDKTKKGRQAKGSRHGMSKLTEEIVRTIRRELKQGVQGVVLARRYGVSATTISAVVSGQNWSHI